MSRAPAAIRAHLQRTADQMLPLALPPWDDQPAVASRVTGARSTVSAHPAAGRVAASDHRFEGPDAVADVIWPYGTRAAVRLPAPTSADHLWR